MKATMLDFRKQPGRILRALDRHETVTVLYRGKPRALLSPLPRVRAGVMRAAEHPAFGMWRDHPAFRDPVAAVRKMRAPRFRGL